MTVAFTREYRRDIFWNFILHSANKKPLSLFHVCTSWYYIKKYGTWYIPFKFAFYVKFIKTIILVHICSCLHPSSWLAAPKNFIASKQSIFNVRIAYTRHNLLSGKFLIKQISWSTTWLHCTFPLCSFITVELICMPRNYPVTWDLDYLE